MSALLDAFLDRGVDLFTGVPCSLLGGLFLPLERGGPFRYVPAVREDIACGIAAGAWLGGGSPVVLMQNSGLGTGLNALTSLLLLYGVPCPFVVGWRGKREDDAPEHRLSGRTTIGLLDLVGVPHRELGPDPAEDAAWAVCTARSRRTPAVLLVVEAAS